MVLSEEESLYGVFLRQLSSPNEHTRNRLMLCLFQHEKVTVGAMSARPRNPKKRTKKLSAPAYEAEVNAFYAACDSVKLVPATTLRELAAAFVVHVEAHGSIVTPIRFADTPRKS